MKLYLATFDQLIGLSIILFLTLVVQLIHIAAIFYQFSGKQRLMLIALPATVFFYTLFTTLEATFVQIKTIECGFAPFPELLRYAPLVPVVGILAELINRNQSMVIRFSKLALMFIFLGRLPFFDENWGSHYYAFVSVSSVAVLIYSTLSFNRMIIQQKSTITAASPKAIFDSMVYGALIANRKGKVLIINPAMNRLLKILALTEPEYIKDLEAQLNDRVEQNQVQATPEGWLIQSAERSTIWFNTKRFKAKNSWHYMITATDVTSAYLLMQEIEQTNLELEEANRRLVALVEGAAQTAALSEKVRINQLAHDILGQRLTLVTSSIDLAVYKGIGEKDNRIENSAILLNQSLEDLFNESEIEFNEMMQSLSEFFALIDVTIHFTGPLPQSKHAPLLGRILREAVTNAVKHGRAANIYVDIKQSKDRLYMSIKNDGILPNRPISFNTGIEGISRQVLEAGGCLDIETAEEFILKISLP